MTAPVVTVILDRYDGSRGLITQGMASWSPSMELPDPADRMLVGQAPVTAGFGSDSPPSVQLVPNDAIGPQQGNGTPGWTWDVTYQWVPGAPATASYYVCAGPASFTATDAAPSVFTWTPTGALTTLPNGTGVRLSAATGGFETATTYYVVGANGAAIQLAAAQGGSPLASTAAFSGELTVVQYNLSALAPTPAAQPGQLSLPVPSGTPAAGDTIVMSGVGYGASFGVAGGNMDGGSALTGELPVGSFDGGGA